MPDEDLLRRWEETWPAHRPYADELRSAYPERWVHFHSLPQSKRYPENEDEYAIVLDRYNTHLGPSHLRAIGASGRAVGNRSHSVSHAEQ
jgi:hypothetical protein